MKLLIACADYPNPQGGKALYYAHTRNLYYVKHGHDVSVLNFAARETYVIDGISVYCLKEISHLISNSGFDFLVCHAANIKYHYIFLLRYGFVFKKIFFVFHGHEVLRVNKVYSKPYGFTKDASILRKGIQDVYDTVKLAIWRNYFCKNKDCSYLLFVSKWMYDEFIKWTKIDPEVIKSNYSITYNAVGKLFETIKYDVDKVKEYDLITIRGNLDNSKYAIDIVNRLAVENPALSFLIIGKGDYYTFNEKPNNVHWVDRYLNHDEIVLYMNKSKCALMPTRTDAQGVMMCEMATFGIPLITSNIPVCQDVFDGFDNVFFIDNEAINIDLTNILNEFSSHYLNKKNETYFEENTTGREILLFKELLDK